MTTGHRVAIKGYRVKDGKVVRDECRLAVSERLRQRKSKRVRVAKRSSK